MLTIAHLSDLHIDEGHRSLERGRRVMAYLAGLRTPVDVVLVTGDIADHGAAAEYAQARRLIGAAGPVLLCPGNHDVREAFREVLLGEPAAGTPINHAYAVGGARFLMCDSSIPGRDNGVLAGETLDWLEAELATASGVPTFICFHHPPVALGIPYVDRIRLDDTDRLATLVARYDNVVAVLCGHAHTPAAATFGGKPLLVAPGVVSTLRLPFESETVVDEDLPPMLALHLLDSDRRLTTHYRVVP